MATAKETKLKTIQHLLYELGYNPDDKIPLRNVLNTCVASEENAKARESSAKHTSEASYKDCKNGAVSIKPANNMLRKSKSDREAANGKKKKSRVKSFTDILLGRMQQNKLTKNRPREAPRYRKEHPNNHISSPTRTEALHRHSYDPEHTENVAIHDPKPEKVVNCETYDPEQQQYPNEDKTHEECEESFEAPDQQSTEDKLRDTIFALSDKIQELEGDLEASRVEAAIIKSESEENEQLLKRIELLQDETERLEIQVAFLQEEKDEAENNLSKSQQNYQELNETFRSCCEERRRFKRQFVDTKRHAQNAIAQMVATMNNLLNENRQLLQHGLKGAPEEYKKILKVTDEYMKLQADKNSLYEECEGLISKLVTEQVRHRDLERELLSAASLLEKKGLQWRPSSEFEEDYQWLTETPRRATATLAITNDVEEYLSTNEDEESKTQSKYRSSKGKTKKPKKKVASSSS